MLIATNLPEKAIGRETKREKYSGKKRLRNGKSLHVESLWKNETLGQDPTC
jgi:hypothetical protein